MSRRYSVTIWCTLLFFVCFWNVFIKNVDINDILSDGSSTIIKTVSNMKDTTTVSLMPGELPGYTGWARLEHTQAGFFRIVNKDTVAVVGKEWNVIVECTQCNNHVDKHHALFYARMYGPAVLVGMIKRNNHSTNQYTITFSPMDAGLYTVEVVLVSSGAPSWDKFPVSNGQEEPWYEGFVLPEFPLLLQVVPPSTKISSLHDVNRTCNMSNLVSVTANDAYYKARWVVVDKLSHRNHHSLSRDAASHHQINLQEYRSGRQSLGIFMDYRFATCRVDSFQDASVRLSNYIHDANDNVHVVFVGDSIMRLQRDLFVTTVPNVQTSYICNSGGLVVMMQNITSRLHAPAKQEYEKNKHRRVVVIFNSGLHDIAQLCSRDYIQDRHAYISQSDSNFSCTAQYRHSFRDFVNLIQEKFPAQLTVFQTTTAGWLRYGNFGFEWPTNKTQSLALTPNIVQHFNDIALDVLNEFSSSIKIVDGYWITLVRPDNRQVGLVNNCAKHLIHPGKEVLQAMVRNLMLVLLQDFGGA